MTIWEGSEASSLITCTRTGPSTVYTENIVDVGERLKRFASRVNSLLTNLKALGDDGEAVLRASGLYPLGFFQVARKDRRPLPRDDTFWKLQIQTLRHQFKAIQDRGDPHAHWIFDERLWKWIPTPEQVSHQPPPSAPQTPPTSPPQFFWTRVEDDFEVTSVYRCVLSAYLVVPHSGNSDLSTNALHEPASSHARGPADLLQPHLVGTATASPHSRHRCIEQDQRLEQGPRKRKHEEVTLEGTGTGRKRVNRANVPCSISPHQDPSISFPRGRIPRTTQKRKAAAVAAQTAMPKGTLANQRSRRSGQKVQQGPRRRSLRIAAQEPVHYSR